MLLCKQTENTINMKSIQLRQTRRQKHWFSSKDTSNSLEGRVQRSTEFVRCMVEVMSQFPPEGKDECGLFCLLADSGPKYSVYVGENTLSYQWRCTGKSGMLVFRPVRSNSFYLTRKSSNKLAAHGLWTGLNCKNLTVPEDLTWCCYSKPVMCLSVCVNHGNSWCLLMFSSCDFWGVSAAMCRAKALL